MAEISITLTIADRPYKLIVQQDEEQIFREAAQLINERIKSYSANYAFKDRQDLLAMVSLQYTTNALKNERVMSFRDKDLMGKLTELKKLLDTQNPVQ